MATKLQHSWRNLISVPPPPNRELWTTKNPSCYAHQFKKRIFARLYNFLGLRSASVRNTILLCSSFSRMKHSTNFSFVWNTAQWHCLLSCCLPWHGLALLRPLLPSLFSVWCRSREACLLGLGLVSFMQVKHRRKTVSKPPPYRLKNALLLVCFVPIKFQKIC